MATESALYRIGSRELEINTIIDIGASDGRWTGMALQHLPHASAFLVEAQQPHEKELKNFVKKYPQAEYIISAAGREKGHVSFEGEDLFGGKVIEGEVNGQTSQVPVDSIDNWVSSKNLTPPFLIKLDTHGYEVPILEGATSALKETNLLVIECYNFQIGEDSLLFHQMVDYMDSIGFRCIDISEPLFREKDLSFWQIDLFFVRANRKEFDYNSYV